MPTVPAVPAAPAVRRSAVLLLLAVLTVLAPALAPPSAGLSATAEAAASLTLTPDWGSPGDTTTARASGFPARARITLTVAQRTFGQTSDATGTAVFTAVAVPAPPAGQTTVSFVASGAGLTARAAFTISATQPPPPPPGSDTCPSPGPTALPNPRQKPAFGVSVREGFSGTEVDTVTTAAGEAPEYVLAFADMTRTPDRTGFDNVAARDATPVLTLEPWDAAAGGTVQPAYSLDTVVAGRHDARLGEWAQVMKCFAKPVLLRFGHEMNGTWYPWAEGVNGNEPGDYVAAWRHVHALFTAAGATNVEWLWAPNVPFAGSTPLPGLYPGDDVVDVLGLDGYNFGTSETWSSWQAPEAVLGQGLAALRTRTGTATPAPKQIIVTETASAERGGSKPEWIRAFVPYLAAQPDVTGFVWFHHRKETDWRFTSTRDSAAAFKEALAARRR